MSRVIYINVILIFVSHLARIEASMDKCILKWNFTNAFSRVPVMKIKILGTITSDSKLQLESLTVTFQIQEKGCNTMPQGVSKLSQLT